MAEDLTPRIVQQYDSAELQAGGAVRNTTVVRYVLGRFGPYEAVFDRDPSKYDVEQVMQQRKDKLLGLV